MRDRRTDGRTDWLSAVRSNLCSERGDDVGGGGTKKTAGKGGFELDKERIIGV